MSELAVEALRRFATNPALVTVDLHRGHLDPAVATLPLSPERAAAACDASIRLVDVARDSDIPVVHVVTAYRAQDEIRSNPFWAFQEGRDGSSRARIAEHNFVGMPGLELMPHLWRDGDVRIDTKKRYDCFIGTDLEFVLRSGGHDAVILAGVNTNSCVIATAIAASVRDWAVFVVEEAVDTMLDRSIHDAARTVIAASFGWVIGLEPCLSELADRKPATHKEQRHG